MSIIVQKFGGTSVETTENLKHVAQRVIRHINLGHNVVVVVSARGDTTDRLIKLAKRVARKPSPRELDFLLATGEMESASLLSMILNDIGQPSICFTGFQAGIFTDDVHTDARITKVQAGKLRSYIEEGWVPVVAGFQGMDSHGDITTLGRGGSDTTAVAIAAALNAEMCEIYTDVEGVYTIDPDIVPTARKIKHMAYKELEELTYLGAKVVHPRAAAMARIYQVPLHIRSTFSDNMGTIVTKETEDMEKVDVRAIALDKDQLEVTYVGVPNNIEALSEIFNTIANDNIFIDVIAHGYSKSEASNNLTFTIRKKDKAKILKISKQLQNKIGFKEFILVTDIAKVSVVGSGLRQHIGVASRMFKALADEKIHVYSIGTSDILISCLVPLKLAEKAAWVLHEAFGLSREDI